MIIIVIHASNIGNNFRLPVNFDPNRLSDYSVCSFSVSEVCDVGKKNNFPYIAFKKLKHYNGVF